MGASAVKCLDFVLPILIRVLRPNLNLATPFTKTNHTMDPYLPLIVRRQKQFAQRTRPYFVSRLTSYLETPKWPQVIKHLSNIFLHFTSNWSQVSHIPHWRRLLAADLLAIYLKPNLSLCQARLCITCTTTQHWLPIPNNNTRPAPTTMFNPPQRSNSHVCHKPSGSTTW